MKVFGEGGCQWWEEERIERARRIQLATSDHYKVHMLARYLVEPWVKSYLSILFTSLGQL